MRAEFNNKREQTNAVRVLQESGLVDLIPTGKIGSTTVYSVYLPGSFTVGEPQLGMIGHVRSTSVQIDRSYADIADKYLDQIREKTKEAIKWDGTPLVLK